MTLQLPALLALLGAALMTIAIFAPKRPVTPVPIDGAPAITMYAERFAPAWQSARAAADEEFARPEIPVERPSPSWPLLVDRRAIACDAAVRLDLVAALAELRAPWADAILDHAREDETDELVIAALRDARGADDGASRRVAPA